MKTKYKYFSFEKAYVKSNESPYWFCTSKSSNYPLGVVKWFPDWKQFCFFPEEETVFSTGCLNDVVDFVTQLNELHNKERG